MTGKRKRYGAEFKARVALEALRGELTAAQLAAKHGVHQTMAGEWRKQAVEGLASVLSGKEAAQGTARPSEAKVEKLHAKIGQPVAERDFWPRLWSMSLERRRQMIEPGHPGLSVVRQCELPSVSRSGFYDQSAGGTAETLALMRLIDAQFLDAPWHGSRQMARHLRREGHVVGRKRVRRLMAVMGLSPVHQRPRTTVPNPEHRAWPYLLRDVAAGQPDHV